MNFLTDSIEKLSELTNLELIEIDRPVLTFDVHKKQLIYSFVARAVEDREYIIELRINITEMYRLERVLVYASQEKVEKPVIVLPTSITVFAGEEFDIPITNNIQSNNECELFACTAQHLEMIDKLKAAQEKGCF